MKSKALKAVEFKQRLQTQAQTKLARLSDQEQLRLLRLKFGHLTGTAQTIKRRRRKVVARIVQ